MKDSGQGGFKKRTITRSTEKKHEKKVKKLIKKLRDDNDSMKKEYDEKVAKLHIQLLDREYYNNSTLDNYKLFSRDPWDRAVYRGFRTICTF